MTKVNSTKNSQTMKILTFVIGIYFLPGTNTHAKEIWRIQFEPLYMGIAGNDKHQSNIKTTTYNFDFSSSTVFPSSSVNTSNNFNMSGNGTFRGQLEYMPDSWGMGVSGWWFDSSDSINQNLNSSVSIYTISALGLTRISNVNYTSNNFSLYAPTSYSGSMLKTSAKNRLGVWNIDIYALKMLGEFQNSRVILTFGAKFGSIENTSSEAFNQGPATEIFGGYTFSQNGNATNSANANFLTGPSIGIQSLGKYGKHRLEGLLSESVLIGNVNRKTFSSSQYSYSSGNLSSLSSSLSNSETVVIPITEIKIKYLYDVTESISLGFGFFASAWTNTPMTPNVQFNDQQYKTLFFYGGLASINLRY